MPPCRATAAHYRNGRGSAISSLSVQALPSLTAVSRESWNALFPPTAEDWDFLRTCEMAPPAGFSASALAAFEGDQPVGAIPLFKVKFSLAMAFGPPLNTIAGWLAGGMPTLMNPLVLAAGSPQTEECPIGIRRSASASERTRILAALLQGLLHHAAAVGGSILALKDVTDSDALWAHETLIQAGFSRFPSLPVAVLELPFRAEAEYLATFSARLRSELRRKMKQAAEVEMEMAASIDDIHEEVAQLFHETRSHRRVDYGSFDDVGPNFFPELMRNLNGRARVMLCRLGGELVSFNVFLVERNRVLAKYIGMRYPSARQFNLYYYNWLMMARFCIDHAIPQLQTGQTTYEIKMRLGSKLKRSWIYFRHLRPLTNRLLHAAAPFAALDRTDADLRELGTKAVYLPANCSRT
jgi:predicted N-acyltransferase